MGARRAVSEGGPFATHLYQSDSQENYPSSSLFAIPHKLINDEAELADGLHLAAGPVALEGVYDWPSRLVRQLLDLLEELVFISYLSSVFSSNTIYC